MAANHLSTANSELPEYIAKNARTFSVVQVGDGAKRCGVIYNGDGSINTGHIPSWKLVPFKEQNLSLMKGSDWASDTREKVTQNLGDVVIQTKQQLITIVSIN